MNLGNRSGIKKRRTYKTSRLEGVALLVPGRIKCGAACFVGENELILCTYFREMASEAEEEVHPSSCLAKMRLCGIKETSFFPVTPYCT